VEELNSAYRNMERKLEEVEIAKENLIINL
jgi:hypothetical protein